jgi:D-tyrosyl-tRNA(Tyr) deacylase
MKVLLQRVKHGSVSVDGAIIGSVGVGYVALVGIRTDDTEDIVRQLANKTLALRIFPDDAGKMNRSIVDINGGILVISQFTLYADTRRGNRPGFSDAARPETAEALYLLYVSALRAELGESAVTTGRFGAHMDVTLLNDGPVTIELSSDLKN